MTIQTATQGGLEVAAKGVDAERLSEKGEAFIRKELIRGPAHLVEIPDNARYMRTKGGEALFYVTPPAKNHATEIPQGARVVQFPDYSVHGQRHIMYGSPKFYYGIE